MQDQVEAADAESQDVRMETPDAGQAPVKRSLVRRLLPLAVLAVGCGLFFALGLDRYLSFSALEQHHEWLTRQVRDNAVLSAAAFVGAYALVAAFSIPGGAVLTIVGGFLFGTVLGTVYAVIGASAGSVAVFLAARTALADALRQKAGGAIKRMREGFQEHALSYLLVLRLIPIFPFWLVNLVPAFVGVPLTTYVVGTFLGIIPGTFVYASLGNGLGALLAAGKSPDLSIIFAPEILTPIVGLAILAILPVVYKKLRRRHAGSGS